MRNRLVAAVKVSRPDLVDCFETLGVPRAFRLDEGALQARFYALSRELHPDRNVGSSMQQMSLVNRAYDVLRRVDSRRAHVLALEGISADSAAQGVLPKDLAEDWFDARDSAQGIAEFEPRLKQIIAEHDAALERLELAYDTGAARDTVSLNEIAARIQTRNYLKSLQRDVEKIRKSLCR